ncbi:DUF998 domain-containing protein [Mycobacterium parmense]|uniref:Uncharacterized protein n=1 Tax=Mycobacterium parmense TaxID=185642 RepID=A0A7I7Z1K6_9MYCO|nr:DUF998 domain-containing protein [Mycobacterium parmense]MCV7352397.1 DUF998 domain-containing protein [Mycobacterium parmense]ORW56356.1 hypothetical protein AWC20_16830 [Mycobacterium parmense]BBZ47880.1 hypothetical protein MPRM_51610 [Mycobacterium parmense]
MTVLPQNARRRFVRGAVAAWTVAGLSYLVLEAVAAAAFPVHYSYSHNLVSDLGAAPGACLINAAFCVQGTLFLAGAVLVVRGLAARGSTVFAAFAAADAVGNYLVAAFHSAPAGQTGQTAWLHQTGALLAIVGGNLAVLSGSSVLGCVCGRCYRGVSVGLASLGLLAFVVFATGLKTGAACVVPLAVWERSSIYSIIGWQVLTAGCLVVRDRRT